MSPERQRVVIAEMCGWSIHPKDRFLVIPPNSPHSVQSISTIPDYLRDLNSMADAERCLFGGSDLWQKFVFALLDSCNGSGMSALDGLCCLVQSTAAQRAEAFLRTLNKWEES